MDTIFAVAVGLGLRALIDVVAPQTFKASALVGVWEGVVLNHFVTRLPSSLDPYVAFAFRLVVDYFLTASITRLVVVVLWTGLGMVLADVGAQMSEDRRFRRLGRRIRRTLSLSHSGSSSSRSRVSSSSSSGSRSVSTRSMAWMPTALRRTTRPVPGAFDQYSEVSAVTPSIPSEGRPSPQSPSELEYINLPTIPDVPNRYSPNSPTTRRPTFHKTPHREIPNSSSALSPPSRVLSPPKVHSPRSILTNPLVPRSPVHSPPYPVNPVAEYEDEMTPGIRSGLTTPDKNPIDIGRNFDDEDRPIIHSGLTTPDHSRSPVRSPLRSPLQIQTKGLPLATLGSTSRAASRAGQDVGAMPIHLTLSGPSPKLGSAGGTASFPVPVLTGAKPSPTLIPPANEIPNIPTPEGESAKPRTPPPTFSEAMDGIERVSSVGSDKVPDSAVSGGRNTIILKADEMRKLAVQQEAERDRIREELRRARQEKRSFDILRLEMEQEEAHQAATEYHAKAARRYIRAHNPNPQPAEIDIHRLGVTEATIQVKQAVRKAIDAGASELRIITGRGKHSKNNIPVLKNHIITEMARYRIEAITDPKNPGVLTIKLPKPEGPSGSGTS